MKLVIQNLSKTNSNGEPVLNKVNLTVGTGMFGLLGPQGAGKSSLMRIIATLQDPDSGTVMLDKYNMLTQRNNVREHIGYLPQEFGVYPKIDAETLLNHLAILKGVSKSSSRKELVQVLLENVGLYDVRKKNLEGYSRAMRQRFGLAQALITNPALLIVDEPTAGLDPTERSLFLNLLSEVSEQRTVILATQIVEDVRELCKNMAIMNGGEIIYTGTPGDAIAEIEGKVWRGYIPKNELPMFKSAFNVISERMIGGEPIVTVYSEDSMGVRLTSVTPDLEDVYFAQIKRFNHFEKSLRSA